MPLFLHLNCELPSTLAARLWSMDLPPGLWCPEPGMAPFGVSEHTEGHLVNTTSSCPTPRTWLGPKTTSAPIPPWNSVSAVASGFALNLEAEVTATRALFLLACWALAQLLFAELLLDARPWADSWPLGPWLALADIGSWAWGRVTGDNACSPSSDPSGRAEKWVGGAGESLGTPPVPAPKS